MSKVKELLVKSSPRLALDHYLEVLRFIGVGNWVLKKGDTLTLKVYDLRENVVTEMVKVTCM